MVSEFIVHVDESDFEYEVLQYSTQVPVVVDFWAEWCIPCRVLGPKLETLAREGEGRFRLAKVNVDENSNLARRYKVRNIPAVKGFLDGRVAAEFAGVLGDEGLRDFISRLTPAPEDLLFAKGKSLIELGDYAEAEDAFREFLSVHPDHPGALLGLIRALLVQGKGEEAALLLRNFPASPAYGTAQLLKPVAGAYCADPPDLLEMDDPLEAAYWNGIRLAKRGNVLAAMDGYLDILRQDKAYRKGEVKDIFVGWLALIGENHPDARQYRQDLSKVLF
jgi:putative thioredoxin